MARLQSVAGICLLLNYQQAIILTLSPQQSNMREVFKTQSVSTIKTKKSLPFQAMVSYLH
jgi:hypothetical protein